MSSSSALENGISLVLEEAALSAGANNMPLGSAFEPLLFLNA